MNEHESAGLDRISMAVSAHKNQDYDHCNTYALLAQASLLASINQNLSDILEELRRGVQR